MAPILIITRPEPRGARFAEAVNAFFGERVPTIISPLMRIVPLDVTFVPAAATQYIFTSVNGVAQAIRLGITSGAPAWCVGERTAQAAQKAGYVVRTGPGDASQLRNLILQEAPDVPLAHIRGRHARGDIATTLTNADLNCADVIAYDQMALPPTEAATAAAIGTTPLIFPLFSPRTATILAGSMQVTAPAHMIAISPAAAQIAAELNADTVTTAARPDEGAMVAATVDRLQRLRGRGK